MSENAVREPVELLARAPLFESVSPQVREAALQVSFRQRYRAHEFLFYQEEPATTFHVFLEGRARLIQMTPEGHQVIIRYVGPGDGIGIIVALSGTSYPLSAEAVTECVTLAWDSDSVSRLLETYPELALSGMRLIAGRFRGLQRRFQELATEKVEQRVARTLLRLARQVGRKTENGVLIDLPLSRQDLGEMTGTTLYTVSRILSRWEQDGLISTGRERVVICYPHGLVTIAEDLPDRLRD